MAEHSESIPPSAPSSRWIAYLLDELDEEERVRIEDAAFTDSASADAIDRTLAGLLDAYVAGELPPGRARAMRDRIARSTDLQRRLAFAEALQNTARASTQAARRTSPLRRFAPVLALAAAIPLVAGVALDRYRHAQESLVVAMIDLAPATRAAESVPTLALPASADAGIAVARLPVPVRMASRPPTGDASEVTYAARVTSRGRPPYDTQRLVARNGRIEVRIPVSVLSESRVTIAVFEGAAEGEPVAFFEMDVERHAAERGR